VDDFPDVKVATHVKAQVLSAPKSEPLSFFSVKFTVLCTHVKKGGRIWRNYTKRNQFSNNSINVHRFEISVQSFSIGTLQMQPHVVINSFESICSGRKTGLR